MPRRVSWRLAAFGGGEQHRLLIKGLRVEEQPKRNLNNGQLSLHAALIAAAAPQPGEPSWSAPRGG